MLSDYGRPESAAYNPPILVVGAAAATLDGEIVPRIAIVLDDDQSFTMDGFERDCCTNW